MSDTMSGNEENRRDIRMLSQQGVRDAEHSGEGWHGIDRLISMLLDPVIPLEAVLHQIAVEMAKAVAELERCRPGGLVIGPGRSRKQLNDLIDGLRELQRSVSENKALERKSIFDIGGEEARYLESEWCGCMVEAAVAILDYGRGRSLTDRFDHLKEKNRKWHSDLIRGIAAKR